VVADHALDLERAGLRLHGLPQVPLEFRAGGIGLHAVHHGVAAGDDQVGGIVAAITERLHVGEAALEALGRAALRLHVQVGEVCDAEPADGGRRRRRCRRPRETGRRAGDAGCEHGATRGGHAESPDDG
jgi:hypothetical protein